MRDRGTSRRPTAQEPENGSAGNTPGLSVEKVWRIRRQPSRKRRRTLIRASVLSGIAILTLGAIAGWLTYQAAVVRNELTSASLLIADLRSQLASKEAKTGRNTLDQLLVRTHAAKAAVSDPVWMAAAQLPWVGPNFAAVSEIANSTDDVANSAAKPMLNVLNSLNWNDITPVNGKFNVAPLAASSPSIVTAARTVELTYSRLQGINPDRLLPEVRRPLAEAVDTLHGLRGSLSTAADASRILPAMLGEKGPRNYLVLVQNSAEVRATGGLPGALAVIHIEDGVITLTSQSSGSAMGIFDPPVEVDPAQSHIYTKRLGTYIGDVNLTPDFPTAARSAKAMWEDRHGGVIDGVIALDPVVLAHILEASGPMPGPESDDGLPTTLTAANVVQTLLSDVYTRIPTNDGQDAYFASVSQEIFRGLASGKVPGGKLVPALTRSAEENRLHVWSDHKDEQKILETTGVGGAISGQRVGGATFGVYFNDGTGAKMDFYVNRTVQLVKECTDEAYSRYKMRITLQNAAPIDAATSLPTAVTGGGRYGIPAGTVQTNVVAYGPAQAQIETVHQDGVKTSFGSQLDGERPVGTVTTRLKPGQSSTVDFMFRKIIQDDEPVLLVTPTVQPVKDVIKPPVLPACTSSQSAP